MKWIKCLPCKPGVAGLIPGFDKTKLWSHLHMTLAVVGTLNKHTRTLFKPVLGLYLGVCNQKLFLNQNIL